jgi:cell division transport system permease protein
MSRLSFLLREALVNLRRNALVVIGAVLAVFLSMGLAFAAIGVNEILRINTLAWQDGTHVMAFFKEESEGGMAAEAQIGLTQEVAGWEEVKEATYVDKPSAYLEFQELFADRPDFVSAVDPATIPSSIRIKLNDINSWRDVQFRLQAMPTFQRVTTLGDQIDQLSSLSQGLRLAGLGLSLVLGAAAVILIANTIRMAIYARRDEVAIMKLVGASNWFIRVPFLLEGLIEGVLGAGLAVLTVWILFRNLAGAGEAIRLFTFDIDPGFFLSWGTAFVFFGAAAGVLGSLVGLSRYLREADGGRTAGAV